jgi:hypothetical protein
MAKAPGVEATGEFRETLPRIESECFGFFRQAS